MKRFARFLNASDAARHLGVSAKALRLYEQRGLLAPVRTAAGWRSYGPAEMGRAAEIAAFRTLGLSLAQVACILAGDPKMLEAALATHQATLEVRARDLAATVAKIRTLRSGLAQGHQPANAPECVFDLPWPWGGELFELGDIRPITYIIGPLGSGKTRLARRIAETLPGAAFLGLDRPAPVFSGKDGAALKSRVDQAISRLALGGAPVSDALLALLAGLACEGPATLVVDMVEQGLDHAAQEAVIAWLRGRGPGARPVFLLTRSSAILDLMAVGADEAIILCPANHSPPTRVAAVPGSPGYEAVATCLASPAVRARTAGLVATLPKVA